MPTRKETVALARQGWLLASRRIRSRVPRQPSSDRVAVFVHGFMAGGAVLDPLRRSAAAAGIDTAGFHYDPLRPFESTARRLAEKCDRIQQGRELVLVGHSLGGLFARYVHEVEGVQASRLVTLATPHRGTASAEGIPGSLGRSLRPGSPILNRLSIESPLPHVAIVGTEDSVIVPLRSATPEGAIVHRLDGVGHNELIFDARAHRLVVDAIRSPDVMMRPLILDRQQD